MRRADGLVVARIVVVMSRTAVPSAAAIDGVLRSIGGTLSERVRGYAPTTIGVERGIAPFDEARPKIGDSCRSIKIGTDFVVTDQLHIDALTLCGYFMAPQKRCSCPYLDPPWHSAFILPFVSLRVCTP